MPLIEELEPETEEFLLRLVPDLADRWQGATPEQVDELSRLAGRPLPRFYQWFQLRMGRDMGPLSYRSLDFSASRVIASYAEPLLLPNPRFFMIGFESNEMMPLHVLYDFDFSVRDDARVTRRHVMGGSFHPQFETLREMIVWGIAVNNGVEAKPQKCDGMLVDPDGDVIAQLEPVMRSLGFSIPVPTGSLCGIFERADAFMVTSSTPGADPGIHAYRMGGNDSVAMRRVLGEISSETELEVDIDEWDPRLT
jgi:hypothetical protein